MFTLQIALKTGIFNMFIVKVIGNMMKKVGQVIRVPCATEMK